MPLSCHSISRACWIISLLLALTSMPLVHTPHAEASQVPTCLVGQWRPVDMEALFRSVVADVPEIKIDSVTGGISLSIASDGAYELRYNEVAMNATMSGTSASTTFDGWVKGTMRESGAGMLVATTGESSLTMGYRSGEFTFSDTTPLPEQSGGEPVAFDCGRSRLTFFMILPAADGPAKRLPFDFMRSN